LFAVVGFMFDNWIQSVAAVLMTATAAWMIVARAGRHRNPGSNRA
jgi:ABC-type nickel/cobalt efflux system permease component RcnA